MEAFTWNFQMNEIRNIKLLLHHLILYFLKLNAKLLEVCLYLHVCENIYMGKVTLYEANSI